MEEGKRVLSSRGKLAIVDWKKIEMDFGPPMEERLVEDEIISICKDSGFELQKQSDAGLYNYLLIFGTTESLSKKKRF